MSNLLQAKLIIQKKGRLLKSVKNIKLIEIKLDWQAIRSFISKCIGGILQTLCNRNIRKMIGCYYLNQKQQQHSTHCMVLLQLQIFFILSVNT